MRTATGYELTPTSNGPRLFADVVRELVRQREAADPERRPFFVGHREWFEAYLARTGLPAGQAPLYVRLAHDVGQDMVVDYRKDGIVDAVQQGPMPRVAANVWLFWPKDKGGKPERYSYDDLSGDPHLRVTQRRLVTYRLVDYGDRLWYTEVSGLHGRPTSGPLGLLFDLIGEGKVEESRSAVAGDGTWVVRGRASKWGIDKTETVTVRPDGRVERGTPPGRRDLADLAERLAQPLAIRFKPMPPPP
jgi:hypothetical protein